MSSQLDTFSDALHDFKRSVEITRDVRFQANLRLSRRHRASAYIISILSTYVIALSLIPNIFVLHQFQSQTLLGCSIVLSVFVIFTSLIDGSQNFFYQGELLHQCARKIASIHHDLKAIDPSTDIAAAQSQLKELQSRYRNILDECPVNHDNVDYYREVVEKPHLFPVIYDKHWKWALASGYRFLVFIHANSWMTLHLVALGSISYIVYCSIFAAGAPMFR